MASSLRYNPALDGMRGLAAALVIADHCRVPGFDPGYFGVDLFFVLSGYLITRLLAEEFEACGKINLWEFYLRRFLRLTPPLLSLLAVYLMVAPRLWPQFSLWEHIRDAALAGFYLSDYARAFWDIPRILQHTWSLSVEEHFYLLWPFVVLLLARIELRWRIACLLGLYLLTTIWRIFNFETLGWSATYFRFDTRMSGLIFGALLAMGLPLMGRISEKAANWAGVLACAALVLCLSIGFWNAPWSLVYMTSLAQLAAAGLLIAASVQNTWVYSTLSVSPLVSFGMISYSVYLWHYPAAVFFRELLPWNQTVPIVLVCAISTATVSYLTIERPLQRYRHSLKARELEVNDEREPTGDNHALPAPNAAANEQFQILRT